MRYASRARIDMYATSSNRHASDGAQQVDKLQRGGITAIKWGDRPLQCTRRAYPYAQGSNSRKLPVATLEVRRLCPRLGTPKPETKNAKVSLDPFQCRSSNKINNVKRSLPTALSTRTATCEIDAAINPSKIRLAPQGI